jgi:two-component system sensor histidine kinase PilS (NtrC family)
MKPGNALPPQSELAWRIVGLVNLYRLLAVVVLITTYVFSRPTPIFGADNPRLFLITLGFYFLLGLLLTLAGRRHWPHRRALVLTHTVVDTLAIATLVYTSGGAGSGLAVLLILPVGAIAMLADGREPLVVAAIATLGVLLQQIVAQLGGVALATDYPLAGVMGAVIFIVAVSVWPLATRLRESEALVKRQELDLANLAQLSQYIVQHLRESILVVDPNDRIRLINESAAHMLGDRLAVPGALLGEVSPQLLYRMATWRHQRGAPGADTGDGLVTAADGSGLLEPHFAPLGAAEPAPVLIFLEDTSVLAARVQQSKLAALGRLSASIAHEIRNPVGAMSHAAQLLAESNHADEAELRLIEIMRSNAQRVSDIIENVLSLSRRAAPRPESLRLDAWCRRFREEFCATLQLPAAGLRLQQGDTELQVRMDASHLHQIVWNLCQNALTHGSSAVTPDAVELRYGRIATTGRPFLEVADRGAGIDAADAERVFEPFFTTADRGTGLGLFLARELAEINDATLLYVPRESGGSVFRIVFSDPSRWAAAHAID